MPAQPNQSVIDGLTVLQAAAGREEAVGSRQLAGELGLEPTRVNRLLKTLAALGMLQQTADRRYRPGPGIHVLAAQAMYGSGLLPRVTPILRGLSVHGCVVAMGVLWREQVAYLYHAAPGMAPEQAIGRVGLFPAMQSGIGVALLSKARPRSRHHVLMATRRRGYADVATDDARGTRSLGVTTPGRDDLGLAFAGAIDGRRVPALVEALQTAAEEISRAIESGEAATVVI